MGKECLNCKKLFKERSGQKFCSRSCSMSYRNKQAKHEKVGIICLECGKKISVEYNERNRKFCSLDCYHANSSKRKRVFTEEHKNNISKSKKGVKTGSRLTPANTEFWTKKGFSEMEAINMVEKNQKKASKASNEKRKGKTLEDIYGNKRAEEIKEKISKKVSYNYSNLTIQEKEILKLKNSNAVSKFWATDESNKLREKFSKQRSEYNKTKQRNYLLNLSEAEKQTIKEKKQKTWNNHSDEEKLEITKKRIENSKKSIIKNTWGKKLTIDNREFIVNSSFEEKFIKKCFELGIQIERGPIVKYNWDGKTKYYFIDFKIIKNNKKYLVELKGTHKWYYKEMKNGKLEAKNQAALAYLNKTNYEDFIFILNDVKRYEDILKEL